VNTSKERPKRTVSVTFEECAQICLLQGQTRSEYREPSSRDSPAFHEYGVQSRASKGRLIGEKIGRLAISDRKRGQERASTRRLERLRVCLTTHLFDPAQICLRPSLRVSIRPVSVSLTSYFCPTVSTVLAICGVCCTALAAVYDIGSLGWLGMSLRERDLVW
jgi:hypothetical protein